MRTHSRYYSLYRNLIASKRSTVAMCAGIALVLGATSAGSSLLASQDSQEELTPLHSAMQRLSVQQSSPALQLLGVDKLPTTTPESLEIGSAAAAAAITHIQKSSVAKSPKTVPPQVDAQLITPPLANEPAPLPSKPTPPSGSQDTEPANPGQDTSTDSEPPTPKAPEAQAESSKSTATNATTVSSAE